MHGDYWSDYRIRIWDARTGKLVHELRTGEQKFYGKVEAVQWSPDGEYLPAAGHDDGMWSTESVHVWNVRTGRHRASFTGCVGTITGFVLSDDGRVLAGGCKDGKTLIWDATDAPTQIRALEKSFTE